MKSVALFVMCLRTQKCSRSQVQSLASAARCLRNGGSASWNSSGAALQQVDGKTEIRIENKPQVEDAVINEGQRGSERTLSSDFSDVG